MAEPTKPRMINDVLSENLSALVKIQADIIEMARSIQTLTDENVSLRVQLNRALQLVPAGEPGVTAAPTPAQANVSQPAAQ